MDTIDAVVKVIQHVSPPRGGSLLARLTANCSNIVSTISVRGVTEAVYSVPFDHNGDPA